MLSLFCLVFSCLVLSCLCLVLSCLVFVLSCFDVFSCLVLSYLVVVLPVLVSYIYVLVLSGKPKPGQPTFSDVAIDPKTLALALQDLKKRYLIL